jgi:stalled ribosome alternative rescue factor ArfA
VVVASHNQFGRGRSNDCGRGRDHNHIVNVQNSLFRQKRKNNKKGKQWTK